MSSKTKAIWRWIWRLIYFPIYNTSTIVGLVYLFYGRGEAIIEIVGKPITIDYSLWDILKFYEKGCIIIFALIGIVLTISTIIYIIKKWDKKKEINYKISLYQKQNSKISDARELLED